MLLCSSFLGVVGCSHVVAVHGVLKSLMVLSVLVAIMLVVAWPRALLILSRSCLLYFSFRCFVIVLGCFLDNLFWCSGLLFGLGYVPPLNSLAPFSVIFLVLCTWLISLIKFILPIKKIIIIIIVMIIWINITNIQIY